MEFLGLKGGCTGSSESAFVKMPLCWISHAMAQLIVFSLLSLVVKNTMGDKGPSQDDDPIDETEMFTTYGSFRTKKNSKRWSQKGIDQPMG